MQTHNPTKNQDIKRKKHNKKGPKTLWEKNKTKTSQRNNKTKPNQRSIQHFWSGLGNKNNFVHQIQNFFLPSSAYKLIPLFAGRLLHPSVLWKQQDYLPHFPLWFCLTLEISPYCLPEGFFFLSYSDLVYIGWHLPILGSCQKLPKRWLSHLLGWLTCSECWIGVSSLIEPVFWAAQYLHYLLQEGPSSLLNPSPCPVVVHFPGTFPVLYCT